MCLSQMLGMMSFVAAAKVPGSVPALEGVVKSYSGDVMGPYSLSHCRSFRSCSTRGRLSKDSTYVSAVTQPAASQCCHATGGFTTGQGALRLYLWSKRHSADQWCVVAATRRGAPWSHV